MSVAGILTGSLFSNAASLFGANSTTATKGPHGGQQPSFAALQQQISSAAQSSPTVAAHISQLGQDLNTGNLAAAQADFSAFKLAMSHGPAAHTNRYQDGSGNQSNAATDPLAAAMQAYSSLQLSPMTNGLSTSMMSPASLFDVSA